MLKRYFWLASLLAAALHCTAQGNNHNLQLRATLDFPESALANMWGYVSPDGREYALLAEHFFQGELIIVDITNPDTPSVITKIPTGFVTEVQTYSHYAYCSTGVVVDLSALPDTNLLYFEERFTPGHTLHIDQAKGFLYSHGTQIQTGTTRVYDLNSNPVKPHFVGEYNAIVHDGYVWNDTLYACETNPARYSIVDMSDKSNPVVLGSVDPQRPLPHNSWLLEDHRYLATTNESYPSFLAIYDISDPSDPEEISRFTIDGGNGTTSTPHNTEAIGNWLVTGWYGAGVVIVDAHRPDWPVEIARYDTWLPNDFDWNGSWAAYPFFPSGTVISNSMYPGKLHVFTPNYVRAFYVQGTVTDGCTGLPFEDAQVEIVGSPYTRKSTDAAGHFRTGQEFVQSNYTLRASRPGYVTQEVELVAVAGEAEEAQFALEPINPVAFNVVCRAAITNEPLANLPLILKSADNIFSFETATDGSFNLPCLPAGSYVLIVDKWGFLWPNGSNVLDLVLNQNTALNLNVVRGYYDSFALEYGWQTSSSISANSGFWARGEPLGTLLEDNVCNPEYDVTTDYGDLCYVTGIYGTTPTSDDVDNGSVTLTSPPMLLANSSNGAVLSFSYWFFNGGGNGSTPNDSLEVRATNGTQDVVIFTENTSASEWRESGEIHLEDYLTLNDNVRVSFTAIDPSPAHVVEAAVDVFKVVPSEAVSANQPPPLTAQLSVSPNPSNSDFALRFSLPATTTGAVLEIRNTLGQLVEQQALTSTTGQVRFGASAPAGVYFATVRSGAASSAAVRVVKQ